MLQTAGSVGSVDRGLEAALRVVSSSFDAANRHSNIAIFACVIIVRVVALQGRHTATIRGTIIIILYTQVGGDERPHGGAVRSDGTYVRIDHITV